MKSEKFLLPILMAFFAVFSFCFVLFIINPSLHFHYQQIAWYSDKLFLKYYLMFPGGPGEYIALFISQVFVAGIAGSFVIALSGFLISFFIYKTVNIKDRGIEMPLYFIPFVQVILLALMCDYRYHFSITVNLFIVSGFLLLCSLTEKKWGLVISVQSLVSGIIIYFVSGGMYFLIFMVSSVILSFKFNDYKSLLNSVLLLVLAAIVPFLAFRFVFLTSVNNSFFRSTPDAAIMLRYSKPLVFYVGLAMIPAILLLVKLFDIVQAIRKNQPVVKEKGLKPDTVNSSGISKRISFKWLLTVIQLFIIALLSGFVLYKEFDAFEKKKIEVDYYAYHENWDKVISISRNLEEYDRMVNFQFNRALLNTGHVLDKLFEYEQKHGVQGMFLDQPFSAEITLPNSDLYFDLGNIDESQRYAFESETVMRNSPRVLKRLVLNGLIMNKPVAANTYYNILASNPLEKKWTRKYGDYFLDSGLVISDKLISEKRKNMNKLEGIFGSPPLKLLSQLEKNPKNRKAFEYLIAFDLLEHDLASFTSDFSYIKQFDYKRLPVVMEEAVILFRSQGKGNEVLNQIRISDETTKRFMAFAKQTSANKGNREKAKLATVDFRNTYWYYVLFVSPKVTNLKLDTKPVTANY